MRILLTRNGFEKLTNELNRFIWEERPKASKMIEETRPIGVVEDNPEYMQAMATQELIENKINDLSVMLSNSIVFNKTMCLDDTVAFGATVKFVDCDSNAEKSYTLVSIYESDIDKGLISCEAPFVRNMIGLHSGDIFDFNDKEYEIIDINYSVVIDESEHF